MLCASMVLSILASAQDPAIRDGYALPKDAKQGAMKAPVGELKKVGGLAVIPVEWSDLRHPQAIEMAELEAMLFSRGTYFQQNRARQQVFGSLADYYAQVSYNAVELAGSAHQWVTMDWSWKEARGWGALAPELVQLIRKAIDRAIERDGAERFEGVSNVLLLYMGSSAGMKPDLALWPKHVPLTHDGRPYEVSIVDLGVEDQTPQGLQRMTGVGVYAHEFGHSLGLQDKYGEVRRGGVGPWCLMGSGTHGDGREAAVTGEHRPFHLCAQCKMRLGWLKPAAIDPGVRQKIALRPVERYPDALWIPITGDGKEYYLVENRQRLGFDRGLSGTGVLVWHAIVRGKATEVELVPAHGLPLKDAAWRFTTLIPFPSLHAGAFTPVTRPCSRLGHEGELPVALTNIEVDPNGVAYLEIGDPEAAAPKEVVYEGDRYVVVPPAPAMGTVPMSLAVVPVEFADVGHGKTARGTFRGFYFSSGLWSQSGTLAEYLFQSSGGAAAVTGDLATEWVKLAGNRAVYEKMKIQDAPKTFFGPVLEAMAARGERDKELLESADALLFIVAGDQKPGLFTPHDGALPSGHRTRPYRLVTEASATGDLAGAAALLFRAAGLAGRSAQPAGDKVWCFAGGGTPSLPCSWCRTRLGWLHPHEVSGEGRFALAPLSACNQAVRIPIDGDKEYYLLENRAKWELDRGLPREGLVIWHVTPPDMRCLSCTDAGILDVWYVHDPPQGQAGAAGRYQPFLALPKALSFRLGDGKTEIAGIKSDARSTAYFEVRRSGQ